MARRGTFIEKLALWAVCYTVLVAAIGITSHYWQFGCRTSSWGSTIMKGDVVVARWTALPSESHGFFNGEPDWLLLFHPVTKSTRYANKVFNFWFYFFVYLLPLSAILLIFAMSRIVPVAICRKLRWASLVGCLLLAVTWLISFRAILYVAPWKGECFLMDGNLRVSPASRSGSFDAKIHVNSDPAKKLMVLPSEIPPYRQLGEPAAFLIPFWIPAAVIVAATIALFVRKDEGKICKHCHYNLTGNTSGVCPECGTALKATE